MKIVFRLFLITLIILGQALPAWASGARLIDAQNISTVPSVDYFPDALEAAKVDKAKINVAYLDIVVQIKRGREVPASVVDEFFEFLDLRARGMAQDNRPVLVIDMAIRTGNGEVIKKDYYLELGYYKLVNDDMHLFEEYLFRKLAFTGLDVGIQYDAVTASGQKVSGKAVSINVSVLNSLWSDAPTQHFRQGVEEGIWNQMLESFSRNRHAFKMMTTKNLADEAVTDWILFDHGSRAESLDDARERIIKSLFTEPGEAVEASREKVKSYALDFRNFTGEMVGIDNGGTSTKVAIAKFEKGKFVGTRDEKIWQTETQKAMNTEDILQTVSEILEYITERDGFGEEENRIFYFSTFPGMVRKDGSIVHPTNLSESQRSLLDELVKGLKKKNVGFHDAGFANDGFLAGIGALSLHIDGDLSFERMKDRLVIVSAFGTGHGTTLFKDGMWNPGWTQEAHYLSHYGRMRRTKNFDGDSTLEAYTSSFYVESRLPELAREYRERLYELSRVLLSHEGTTELYDTWVKPDRLESLDATDRFNRFLADEMHRAQIDVEAINFSEIAKKAFAKKMTAWQREIDKILEDIAAGNENYSRGAVPGTVGKWLSEEKDTSLKYFIARQIYLEFGRNAFGHYLALAKEHQRKDVTVVWAGGLTRNRTQDVMAEGLDLAHKQYQNEETLIKRPALNLKLIKVPSDQVRWLGAIGAGLFNLVANSPGGREQLEVRENYPLLKSA